MTDDTRKAQSAQEAQEPTAEPPRQIQIKIDPNPDPKESLAAYLARVKREPLDADTIQSVAERIIVAYPPEEREAAAATIAERLQVNGGDFSQALQQAIEKKSAFSATMGEDGKIIYQKIAKVAAEQLRAAMLAIKAFLESAAYKAIEEDFKTVTAFLREHQYEIDAIANAVNEVQALEPFLQMQLEAAQNDPQYAEYSTMTLDDLLSGMRLDGTVSDRAEHAAFIAEIVERARQQKADFMEAAALVEEVETATEELPRIQYKKTTELKMTTDKLANFFFALAAPEPKGNVDGQRQMIPLRYEGRNARKEITLLYDYSYNEATLTQYGLAKGFTDYDFLVMSVIDNLYTAGNDLVSLSRIYTEMEGGSKPTGKQLEPIYRSLLKGLSTTITIDDSQTRAAWGKDKKTTYHEIISPVIPVQLGNERFIANGKIANGYVKINGYSPFMQVAKPLGHVTAWDKRVLWLYKGRKTERYYSVMRFLMQQIGWMRNDSKRGRKILYSALYAHTGDKTTRAQQLARDTMFRLLDDVFKPLDYIKSYKEEPKPTAGVKLTLSKNRREITDGETDDQTGGTTELV